MSLLSKFPGLQYRDIRAIPVSLIFSQNVAAGDFTWAFEVADVHTANPASFYYIDTLSFSANLDLLVFQNAIDFSYDVNGFSFDVFKKDSGKLANLTAIPFASYAENLDVGISYSTSQSTGINVPTQIEWRINGQLNQTAQIVALGISSITIFVRAVLYEINNLDWVKKYFGSR